MTTTSDDKLVLPDHEDWDAARRAWNLAVDQRPAAVAFPESAEDVAAAIRIARERGLRVAPQATGHRAAPLGPLDDTLLLKTERMRGLAIDPDARIARVEAGVLWQDVVAAAGSHDLAPLAGSGPDVGVIGYALAGGIGWLGRRHGLAANSVESIEAVTADGRLVRADREREADLFWALRGSAGNLAVVTALELRLFPHAELQAGILWWPIERGPEVLHAWRELTAAGVPDELTTVGRYLRYPPIPEIPEARRGKSFVVVEAAYLGDGAGADALLAPLRALGPAEDTVRTIPARELIELHMDPTQPVPGASDGLLLSALPAEAVDELVRLAGAASDSPLVSLELRHLGGELARPRPHHGAIGALDAEFALVAVGIAPTPERAAAVAAYIGELRDALAPWAAPVGSLNFADTRRDPHTFWTGEAYERLRRIKAALDPDDVIRANHPL
jgi:FAD/FMN-containing dehydrogenase